MKTLTNTAIALCMMIGMAAAWAQPPMAPGPDAGQGPQMGGGEGMIGEPGMMMRFLDRLDLTDDQWQQVETIMDDARSRIQALRDEVGGEEPLRAFLAAFAQPTLTVDDLKALTTTMDSMRDRIREITLEAVVRVHDVLTADQLARVADLSEHSLREGGHGGGRFSHRIM